MPVYDLMLKLEGMKALCGDGVTDDHLNYALFYPKDLEDRRSDLSRLKAGKIEFTERLKSALTEEFNARIARNLLPRNSDAEPDGTGLIRNEDWEKPIHELFQHLAKGLNEQAPAALARAHSAIAAAIHTMQQHREHDHALLVADYDPSSADLYRIPDNAAPVDPNPQPVVNIRAGDPMIATLTRPVTDRPARGWLFYVRDPDTREGVAQSHYIWDQDLKTMVHWHAGGPFEIAADHVGPLPGFPARTSSHTGKVTAYLLVEPIESTAVADLLRGGDASWNGIDAPSFDGFANLATAHMRLFQKGNTKSFQKGTLPYPPPKLFLRHYRILEGRS